MSAKPVRKIPASAKRRDLRCASGVEGLDDILAGGLPRDCFYLAQGDPGSGKTTLALQFLLEGVRRGEKVFYISLSETREELLQGARASGGALAIDSELELPLVFCGIEMAFRISNQTVLVDLPKFVATDSNAFSGAAGSGVRSS
jgi:KaiC/GvpD/RAD55 family RecA-like ATPase